MGKRYDDLIRMGVRFKTVEDLREGVVWIPNCDLIVADKAVDLAQFLKACDEVLVELSLRELRPMLGA